MNKKEIMNLAIGIAAGMALFQGIIALLQYTGLKSALKKEQ